MSCTLLIPLCLPAIQLLVVGIRVACDGIQQASMILTTANSIVVWTGTGSLCNYQPTPRNRLISTLESRLGCTTKVHKLFLTTPKPFGCWFFKGSPQNCVALLSLVSIVAPGTNRGAAGSRESLYNPRIAAKYTTHRSWHTQTKSAPEMSDTSPANDNRITKLFKSNIDLCCKQKRNECTTIPRSNNGFTNSYQCRLIILWECCQL